MTAGYCDEGFDWIGKRKTESVGDDGLGMERRYRRRVGGVE